MKMLRSSLVLLTLSTAIMACTVTPKAAEGEVKEFVCYDDDALVERHVGVVSAQRWYESTAWKINYKDGQEAWYHQSPGETCQLESFTPKAPS